MTWKSYNIPESFLSKIKLETISKYIILIIALALSIGIAVFTHYNTHPDEAMHLDAFHYFEGRFWPPDVGSELVLYSRHGVSRVYKGELVYILYGNLAYLLKNIFNFNITYVTYRLFNTAIFIIMIAVLLFAKGLPLRLQRLGLVFLAIPQTYYLFSYANSDAWPIFLSVLIFLCVLRRINTALPAWKIRDILWLGILTGLITVSKSNFMLCLILPYALIAHGAIKNRNQVHPATFVKWLRTALLIAIPVVLVYAPLKWLYPWTQGDFKTKLRAVKEQKAAEGFKAGNPYAFGVHMHEKGFTYLRLTKETFWFSTTFKSFWGVYGYMNSWSPAWIYMMVAFSVILLWIMTLMSALSDASPAKNLSLLFLIVSACVCVMNVWASLYYSLYIDFQAQGRYLFPALIPVSILLLGPFSSEHKFFEKIRFSIFILVYTGGLYSLICDGLIALSPSPYLD
jgi:uncharacterized membrane protein